MKKANLVLMGAMAGALGLASTAHAALREGAFVLSPFANYTWYASKRHLKNQGGVGASVGYAVSNHLLVNASVAGNRTKQRISPFDDVSVMQYAIDGNYYFGPYAAALQPYVGGGVGVQHFNQVLGSEVKTQTNLHANAGLAYFFTQNIGLQGGAQYLYTVTGSGRADFGANLGVVFMFGGGSAAGKNTLS